MTLKPDSANSYITEKKVGHYMFRKQINHSQALLKRINRLLENNRRILRVEKHNKIMDDLKSRYYQAEQNHKYKHSNKDKKLIAFYLPQFHPLEINDVNFGKGFTEWTNVTQGIPRYVGQLQPILPGELGFYDLRVEDTIKKQIDLAKNHGVYGFCFYYYWFSGTKVMDMPIETLIKHKEWDFNFSICWVNAN